MAVLAVLGLVQHAEAKQGRSYVTGPPSREVAKESLEPKPVTTCGVWTLSMVEVPDRFSIREAAPYHTATLYGSSWGYWLDGEGNVSDTQLSHVTRVDRGSSGIVTRRGDYDSNDDVLCHGTIEAELYSHLRGQVRLESGDTSGLVRGYANMQLRSSCDGNSEPEMESFGKKMIEAKGASEDPIHVSFGWGETHVTVPIPVTSSPEITDVGLSSLPIPKLATDNFVLTFHMAQNHHLSADGWWVFTAHAKTDLGGVSWAEMFELKDEKGHCP